MRTSGKFVIAGLVIGMSFGIGGSLRAQSFNLESVCESFGSFRSICQAFVTWQQQMNAFKTLVKQAAVTANQVGTADITADQVLSASISSIRTQDRLLKVVSDYGGEYGQPFTSGCVAQRNAKTHVAAVEQRDLDAAKLMRSFANGRVASRVAASREKWEMRQQTYCSVSEAKQGLCELSANGMQAWDSDYSGPFSERSLSPEGELAGYAYAAMLADTRAPETIDCGTPACHAARMSFLKANATSSMIMNTVVGQVADRRVPTLTGQ